MNVWKQFAELQRGSGLKVAEVVSVGTSESVLQDHAGQTFRALGTSVSIGAKAFVKDEVIQSEAPDLTDVGILYV
jgi:hypothetical protein